MATGVVLAACVCDLDTQVTRRRVEKEPEPEVAAAQTSVQRGIGGEFRDDLLGTLRDRGRDLPGAELPGGEQPGEAGAAPGGGQQLPERT